MPRKHTRTKFLPKWYTVTQYLPPPRGYVFTSVYKLPRVAEMNEKERLIALIIFILWKYLIFRNKMN